MESDQGVTSVDRSKKYSAQRYAFSKEFLSKVSTLQSHKTFLAILNIWIVIALLAITIRGFIPLSILWWCYLPLAFLIAGRQGALLQIVHEGSHTLILKEKLWNDRVGNWFAAYAVGLTVEGYRKSHLQHHAHTNTTEDLPTDLEKYSVADFRDRRLAFLFLRDLVGLTALSSFLGHNTNSVKVEKLGKIASMRKMLKDRVGQGLSQLVLLFLIFQGDFRLYLLFWLLPLISFNMMLLRIRGIAEHGLPNQLGKTILSADEGNFYTRTMLFMNETWIDRVLNFFERIFIGSLNCTFHHEHHLLPKVPFYKLPDVNVQICSQLAMANPLAYSKGYRQAFLMGQLSGKANDS